MSMLKERVDILMSTETITERAKDISLKTMTAYVDSTKEEKYQMLITHLAMAVTRMDRGEELSAPPEIIMQEVQQSPHIQEANKRVEWIEQQLGEPLPQEEKAFLQMHFVSVLNN
ncbi:transcriptional antiterminator [Bacillus sp. LL01]|uniref:PRD domain-containing protein n=1 Tax=Bacillus sp. LL01 TaxID=1665556 RepID=UPI00064CF215|nr:PRD domain-containing protein [Bacillus sp. LL01]KMJ59082.1 transcriptional antiterminator [Bacillus sp. LL01]